jgi:TetR/AcrR family fatty acid metabolism transcriptional regulator
METPYSVKHTRDLKGGKTKQDILEAAVSLFAKNGFHNTTISQIAEAATMTKGAFYCHFKSKEAIFCEVVREVKALWSSLIIKEIGKEGEALGKLVKMFDIFMELTLKNKDRFVIFIVLIAEFTEVDEKFERVLKDAFDELFQSVSEIVEEGKRAGSIRMDIDSRLLAITLIGAWQGIILQWLLNRNRVILRDLVSILKRFILEGISIKGG